MKEAADKKKYKVPFWKTVKKHWMLLAMLAPAVIYVVIFAYIPMTGVVLAFKNYQYAGGIYGSPWNGLDNFKALLCIISHFCSWELYLKWAVRSC